MAKLQEIKEYKKDKTSFVKGYRISLKKTGIEKTELKKEDELEVKYQKGKITITKKGYSKIKLKLINHLTKTLYDKKLLKTSNLEDKFYIEVISKEKLYRYRKKYYKCYKDESLTDTLIHDEYKVTDTIYKYYLYRKETIEVYDDIKLSNYLDLSKIIKKSTIPLSKLEFNYSNTCSKTILTIKYQDFKENIDITFNCNDYSKSKVHKGKTKSLTREIFGILFKTLIFANFVG